MLSCGLRFGTVSALTSSYRRIHTIVNCLDIDQHHGFHVHTARLRDTDALMVENNA